MVETIKRIAKEKGISISKLERGCQLGTKTIYRWDENFPSVDKVMRVARYLGVPVEDLLEEEENDFN